MPFRTPNQEKCQCCLFIPLLVNLPASRTFMTMSSGTGVFRELAEVELGGHAGEGVHETERR